MKVIPLGSKAIPISSICCKKVEVKIRIWVTYAFLIISKEYNLVEISHPRKEHRQSRSFENFEPNSEFILTVNK